MDKVKVTSFALTNLCRHPLSCLLNTLQHRFYNWPALFQVAAVWTTSRARARTHGAPGNKSWQRALTQFNRKEMLFFPSFFFLKPGAGTLLRGMLSVWAFVLAGSWFFNACCQHHSCKLTPWKPLWIADTCPQCIKKHGSIAIMEPEAEPSRKLKGPSP